MNPFEGIKPNLGPFASVLSNPIGILISVVWFGCLIWAAVAMLTNFASFAKARRQNRPHVADEALANAGWTGAAVVLLGAAPVIYGIFMHMAG